MFNNSGQVLSNFNICSVVNIKDMSQEANRLILDMYTHLLTTALCRERERETFPFLQVCVELAKVLLHLSDQYFLDEFVSLRMSAMVSLAVCCPDLVAPYLTDEFYAPNYSLRQRMDMLEVHAQS